MRQVYYIHRTDNTRKLMIYESSTGAYVFGYNSMQDKPADWDQWFTDSEDANHFCIENYDVDDTNWITIADPLENCQHDLIVPTKIKGKEQANPKWTHFLRLSNNKWVDYDLDEVNLNITGMTVNERLYYTGLIDEFDNAMLNNKPKAKQILTVLGVDEISVKKIIGQKIKLVSIPLKIYSYIVIAFILFCFLVVPLANIGHSGGEQVAMLCLAYGLNAFVYILLAACIFNTFSFWTWSKTFWPINILTFLFCIYMLKDGFWIYIGG